MIYFQHDNGMEIRSDKWQCVVAAFVFAIMLYMGLWFSLCVFYPDYFHSADHFELYSWIMRIWYLLLSFIPSFLGFYVFRSTVKYRLYYDSEGIGQSDGFRSAFVRWDTISWYTKENIGWERLVEPVLRDPDAQVVFKPFSPIIASTSHIKQERAQFWKKVTDVIENRVSLH